MNCPRCGKANPDNILYCIYCGTPLSAARKKGPVGKKRKIENILVAIIIVLAAALVALASVFILSKNHRGPMPNAGQPMPPAPYEITSPPYDTEQASPAEPELVPPPETPNETILPPETTLPDPEPAPVQDTAHIVREKKKEDFLDRAERLEEQLELVWETVSSQAEMNMKTGELYNEWDELLNDVYQYLKTILPAEEFEELKRDEIEWIKEKEQLIEEAAAEVAGGTAEPCARHLAGISATSDRVYYLTDFIE